MAAPYNLRPNPARPAENANVNAPDARPQAQIPVAQAIAPGAVPAVVQPQPVAADNAVQAAAPPAVNNAAPPAPPANPNPRPGAHSIGVPMSGILTSYSRFLSGPTPLLNQQPLIIARNSYQPFFQNAYTGLVNYFYEMDGYQPNNLINQEQFTNVCLYLLRARLDQVFSSISGQRLAGRVPLPRDFKVPTCIGYPINDIGSFHSRTFGNVIYPQPWDAEQDNNQRIGNQVNNDMLTAFTAMVIYGENRGYIKTVTIVSQVNGTSYWTLSPRQAGNRDNIADINTNAIQAVAIHSDFTPYDAALMAVVARHFNGQIFPAHIGDAAPLSFGVDPFTSVMQLRAAFIRS